MGEKIILKAEIRSTVKSTKVYAEKDEEIEVLLWMDEVAICQGKRERFPATREKLFGAPVVVVEEKKTVQLTIF